MAQLGQFALALGFAVTVYSIVSSLIVYTVRALRTQRFARWLAPPAGRRFTLAQLVSFSLRT